MTFFLTSLACGDEGDETENATTEYKQKMRDFVQDISHYARSVKNNFIIIPQNGQELITLNGEENGPASIDYLKAISAVG